MIANDPSLALRDARHLLHGYTNLSRHRENGGKVIARGDGVRIFDTDGKDYIEAASGMWCANFGFSENAIVEAAYAQMQRLPYYHTLASKSVEPAVLLAEKLAAIVPIPNARIHFALSGSEANDYLVKFLWGMNNALGRPEKKKVISRINGFHGMTVVANSLGGIARNHRLFDTPIDRFLHVGDIHHYGLGRPGETEAAFAARLADELEAEILRQEPETVMAFLAEPVTGAGGVILPPADYYARVQAVLKKYDVLFLVDEVITGFGRTGAMFGSETFGLKPDAMVLAKGLTAGYQPLAAIVISDEIYRGLEAGSDLVGVFAHGTTYSGHPTGCAVALKVLELMEERDILGHVRAVAPRLKARLDALHAYPVVGETRTVGLIGAVQFVADRDTRKPFEPQGAFASRVQAAAEACGVITRVVPAGDSVAFSPPLVITEAEIDEAFDRFEEGLRRVLANEDRT
jgi:4-aminobutyrate--pyruvate transaminase